MNLEEAIATLREDGDVVVPFAQRLLQRIRERTGDDIRLEDIELQIVVRHLNGSAKVLRMLRDMIHESVSV